MWEKIIRKIGLNLSILLSDEEKEFRVQLYQAFSVVQNEILTCTVCSKKITSAIFKEGMLFKHVVLMCKDCFMYYGDGNFPDDDGTEKYCRLCGNGGKL